MSNRTFYCIRKYCKSTGKSLGVMDYAQVVGLGLRGLRTLAERLNSYPDGGIDYRVERYWKAKEQGK